MVATTGRGRAPVGEQLGDRGVELLVAHAARHQQVGVVLAGGQPRAQLLGPRPEVVAVRGDDAPRARHHRAPVVEGPQHGVVGDLGLGDEQGHLLVVRRRPCSSSRVSAELAVVADVVLLGVAGELALEHVGVLRGAQHDQGVARGDPRAEDGPSVMGPSCASTGVSGTLRLSCVLAYVEPQQPADQVDGRTEQEDHGQRCRVRWWPRAASRRAPRGPGPRCSST